MMELINFIIIAIIKHRKPQNLSYFTEFQGLGDLVEKPKRSDKDAPFEG